MKFVVAMLFALASVAPAWAQDKEAPKGEKQDGEKKAPPKDGGDPVKKPGVKGDGEKAPKKEAGEGPTLSVEEVDTNGDGRISGAELKAALSKLYPKKDGGEPKKAAPKEGAPEKKEPGKDDGDGKKPVPKEGGEKKEPAKDGGEKKPPSKDGQK